LSGEDANFMAITRFNQVKHTINFAAHSARDIGAYGCSQVFVYRREMMGCDALKNLSTVWKILPDARFDPCQQDSLRFKFCSQVFKQVFC